MDCDDPSLTSAAAPGDHLDACGDLAAKAADPDVLWHCEDAVQLAHDARRRAKLRQEIQNGLSDEELTAQYGFDSSEIEEARSIPVPRSSRDASRYPVPARRRTAQRRRLNDPSSEDSVPHPIYEV